MKHDELLARIVFATNTSHSGSSSGGSFSPYALRRSGSASEASFDATVDMVRSEDGKTVTIKFNDFPAGKTPIVSVPVDESWELASVKAEDGSSIEATVSDGYVSLVVSEGGSYTIIKEEKSPVIIVPPIVDNETEEEDSVTVTNPDGSVTTTFTDKTTGTVTEITETADGITATVVTDAEGKITAIKADIPADADTGKAIKLPLEVAAANKQTISIKTNSEKNVSVALSVPDADLGTVAVIIDEDGSESIIQTTAFTEDGIEFSVSDGATVKIIDNSKNFADVADGAWYDDAVKFASARELLVGTGEDIFAPGTATTRAMVWTLLARLEGVDIPEGETLYASAQSWAMENGISDGTNPGAEITREQLVTMLWRYLGEPASNYDLSNFTDHGDTSDWALSAKQWAVESGLIQGIGNNKLDPGGITSRAQLAQVLLNLLNN